MESLQDHYQKTIDFAATAHKKQIVPGKPYSYVVHLSNVAMEILLAIRKSTNINEPLALQCALLHDTIEDTDCTYEDVKQHFGEEVANGVLALTKNESLPKADRMLDSLNRILQQPKEIAMVKCADRITNLQQPPKHWDQEKINNYLNESEVIYEQLKSCNDYLSNRLKSKIIEYKKYTG